MYRFDFIPNIGVSVKVVHNVVCIIASFRLNDLLTCLNIFSTQGERANTQKRGYKTRAWYSYAFIQLKREKKHYI